MGVKIRDTITPEGRRFFRELKELNGLEVRVGFQRGEKQDEDGTDICDVAAWNELGTDRIPARPFIRKSVDENREQIKAFLQAEVRDFAQGRITTEQMLKEIGIFQKELMQDKIDTGSFKANVASTIRIKKSSKPLVDTGRMQQSVNYVIKKKGGGGD